MHEHQFLIGFLVSIGLTALIFGIVIAYVWHKDKPKVYFDFCSLIIMSAREESAKQNPNIQAVQLDLQQFRELCLQYNFKPAQFGTSDQEIADILNRCQPQEAEQQTMNTECKIGPSTLKC